MNNLLLKLYVQFQNLMNREEGQDLIEYALLAALIALAATVTMKSLAGEIETVFNSISASLANSIS